MPQMPQMPQTLDDATTNAIYAEMRKGYALKKESQIEAAVESFRNAWDLVPEPKLGWDLSQITARRFAAFFRDIRRLDEAEVWARRVFECNVAEGDGVPYVLLGSVLFEAGKKDEATEMFSKGFQLSGRRAFGDEDQKYLKLVPKKK